MLSRIATPLYTAWALLLAGIALWVLIVMIVLNMYRSD